MRLDKGPRVHLLVESVAGVLIRSRLQLSDTFRCTGSTPQITHWIEQYLQGNPPHVCIDLFTTDTFQTRVLHSLQRIPFGQTMSYTALANLAGHPKAARAVGNACHHNPFPLLIPCHRVILANGKIGGFALDLEIKKRLLEFEASFTSLPQEIT